MLHIFRKDVWMLRYAVLMAPLEFAAWAWAEVAAGGVPWEPANALRYMVVLGWCYTPSFLLLSESQTEPAQDWQTRPYPRGRMLGAKFLFMALVYHLPYLLACAAILWGKGFAPWNHLGRLLEQQVLVAAFFTLPGLALASVTSGFGQFCGVGFLLFITAMGATLAGDRERDTVLFYDPLQLWWWFALLAVSALGVLVLQFVQRRTSRARMAGAAAVVVLFASFLYVPEAPLERIRCGQRPLAGWSGNVRLGEGKRVVKTKRSPEQDSYIFPLSVPDAGGERLVKAHLMDWKLRTDGGEQFRRETVGRLGVEHENGQLRLRLEPEPSVYRDGEKVEMKVAARFDVMHRDQTVWLRSGQTRTIPGLGNCGTILEDGALYGGFRVYCESPEALSRRIPIRVHVQDRNWSEELDVENARSMSHPWLLPVRRVETYPLEVLTREPGRRRWKREVLHSEASDAAIEMGREEWLGCEVVDLRIAGKWDHAAGRFWPVMERK